MHRPENATGALPGVLHIHGGGMVMLAAAGPLYGLEDCNAALDWVHANREQLGVSKLIVFGESGGGNLTMATVLKAKREGQLDRVDGVFAQCPYILQRVGGA